MGRVLFSIVVLMLIVVSPAFAEGFRQAQFGVLIVVNLALGAVLTLFIGILGSALLEKLKPPRRVEVRIEERRR